MILCNYVLRRKGIDDVFFQAIKNKILNEKPEKYGITNRTIAYGSLGYFARKLLPDMKNTPLWPTLFWDSAATEDSTIYDGSKVTTARPELVEEGDIILCLPKINDIYTEVKVIADKYSATAMSNTDIMNWLADWYYS